PVSVGASSVTAAPASPPRSAPSALIAPPSAGARRRRLRFGMYGVPLVARLLVGIGIVAAVAIPLATVNHTVSSIKVPSFDFGQSSTTQGASASTAPRQADYLQVSVFRSALARVRRAAPGARVALIRIDGRSFSAAVSRPGHGVQQIYF